VRCSLLVLSSYLDGELPPERVSELEAHLIACSRCSTALGYLREESQRVAGLMRVHVDEHATREMFALIGLTSDDPGDVPPPRNTWHQEAPEQTDAPPWMGSSSSRTLPWAPRPAPPQPEYDPPVMEWREDRMEDEDLVPEDDAVAEPAPLETVAEHHEILEQDTLFDAPHDQHPLRQPEPPPLTYSEPPGQTGYEEVELAGSTYAGSATVEEWAPEIDALAPVPEPPPMPVHAPAAGASGLLNRMRDAVAVRLALMRSSKAEMDDSVQIVSGAGAPSWEGRPVNRGYMQRMERRRGGGVPMSPAASSDAMGMGEVDQPPEPTVHQAPEEPASTPHPVAPLYESAVATAIAPSRIAAAAGAPAENMAAEEAAARAPIAPGQDIGMDDEVPPVSPSRPGRHMRSVARGQTNGSSRFSGFGQLTAAVAHRTGAQHGPAVGVSGLDRRLWIFGGAVVVLMLIGILAGKATSQLPSTGVSTHPTAVPSLAPTHASASAAPTATPVPTPVPTPAPPAGGPAQLTDQVTLGAGTAGFQVTGLRYNPHSPSGGYRLVFDISPGRVTGAPRVLMGFGTATTFYVEFSGTTAGGVPSAPAPGGVVTGAKLLQPSPVTGKTIYEFTLARGVNYVANYLEGPRLVIDLK
jgi:hypothetical protein